jgi:gas vesicle protein
MNLVLGFAPKSGSVQQLVDEKAEMLATKIVLRTHQNMSLENQSITDDKIKQSISDLADEIKREMKKSLWD